jgi:AraC-like DNA-binding protein
MDIENEQIEYISGSTLSVKIRNIRHYKPHVHNDALELLYCLKGSINVVSGHERVTLSAGEVFSIDHMNIHCLYSDEDNIVVSFYLDLTNAKQDWEYVKYIYFDCNSQSVEPYQIAAMDEIKDNILLTAYLSLEMPALSENVFTELSDRMLDLLLNYFDWFNTAQTYWDATEDMKARFHRIVIYCEKNYMRKITIRELAEMEHINENYLSRYLSQGSFKGFRPMLNFIRCFEVESLLLTTDLPVIEISPACGFSDPKYCYRHFKYWWGITPQKHRKLYREYQSRLPKYHTISANRAKKIIESEIVRHNISRALSTATDQRYKHKTDLFI